MKMPDEAPENKRSHMIINALMRDGHDLTGAQFFDDDIDEIDRLYGVAVHNQLAAARIKRVIAAAKQCLVVPHNQPEEGELEKPTECWAVKLYGGVHALERDRPIAISSAMTQRKALWAAAGAI